MILPILAYGHPNLRKTSSDITEEEYKTLDVFLQDLWETMLSTDGVGLSAPQVNKQIRIFVIKIDDLEKTFINPHIVQYDDEQSVIIEGCVSVPWIYDEISRPKRVRLIYRDENFVERDEWFNDMISRVIQHEHDHLEGKLFVDRMSSLRKIMFKGKLNDISKGNIKTSYKMIFPKK